MIYSHLPQRSGRSIPSNTNNPPQDPPPQIIDKKQTVPIPDVLSPKIVFLENKITLSEKKITILENKISILEKKTPKQESKITKEIPKKSLLRIFLAKICNLFGRR